MVVRRFGTESLLQKENPFVRCEERASQALNPLALADPACETVEVASGPGMRGILPIACTHVSGVNERLVAPPFGIATSAVGAIKNVKGRVIGTGILLAKDLLLTPRHVADPAHYLGPCGSLPAGIFPAESAPVSVDFGERLEPDGNFVGMSQHSVWGLEYVRTGNMPAKLAIYFEPTAPNLDFVLLRLKPDPERSLSDVCGLSSTAPRQRAHSTNSRATSAPISTDACGLVPIAIPLQVSVLEVSDRLDMLAYTANPYFPRGLIWSGEGRFLGRDDAFPTGASLLHNLQSASGFSGGPLFGRQMSWVGIHTGVGTRSCNDETFEYDFSKASRAIPASVILRELASTWTCKVQMQHFPGGELAPYGGCKKCDVSGGCQK